MFTRVKPFRRIGLLITAAAAISCHDMGNEPEQPLSAITDKATYATEEYIGITVTNNGDFVAHFASCCASLAYYIDKFENGIWRQFSSPGIPCPPYVACRSMELAVAKAETQVGATFLSERGTFRIRVPYGASNENLTHEAVSNSFIVQ